MEYDEVDRLYNGLTDIDDELVEMAQKSMRRKRRFPAYQKGRMQDSGARRAFIYVQRFAVVFLAFLLLFGGAVAASPRLREATLEMIINVLDSKVSISFTGEEAQSGTAEEDTGFIPAMTLTWLPNGGTIESGENQSSSVTVEAGYPLDGMAVRVELIYAKDGMTKIYGQGSEEREIFQVQGYPAVMFVYENNTGEYEPEFLPGAERIVTIWYDEEYSILINLSTWGVAQEDVKKIAEGLRFAGED
ncbi:MAG: hypothetical protein LUE29_04815 [Lachnospiraceae bacterium]|nr:hypothetical protein [Lachnospiraceae bacterium]